MKDRLIQRFQYLAIGCTALLLLAVAYAAFAVSQYQAPGPELPAAATLSAQKIRFKPVSQVKGNAFVERPLFWESRRPYVPEAVVDVEKPVRKGPDPFEDYELSGVFSGDAGVAGVILLNGQERERLMLGEQLHEWELTSLTPERAIFFRISSQGYEEKTLELVRAVSVAAPTQPSRVVEKVEAESEPSISSPQEDK
ncbi:hypothetical protein [Marinobacterium marinum]|uniref:Type II secretion system protein GspC N-terminal domain-containing protein n=1 Tax=Marinobacterium marinum TaxID=2756129 RepID=A0A7W1WVI7_9GAMM|nr:hypothetical protein [Marinobacterium marinum]MBA4501004.1 hypothetical protein [Marinobacterium marinum]